MTTTIHLPSELLSRLDARARARGVSRNRLIREAVEASLGLGSSWPPELVTLLGTPLDRETAELLEGSLTRVRASRSRRRKPPDLG